MATLPTECPKCGKPIEPARWSRGTDFFAAHILIPAQCSGAPACDWEDRFPYVCAYCGSYRRVDVCQEHAAGGVTVIKLGQVCAECERSVGG
jgi:hypothetical protein